MSRHAYVFDKLFTGEIYNFVHIRINNSNDHNTRQSRPESRHSLSRPKMDEIVISKSLENNVKVFKVFGFWLPELSYSGRIAYRIYSGIVILLFFYLYVLSYMTDVVMSIGDLEKFSKGSFLLLTLIAEIFKGLPVQLKQQQLQELLNDLDGETFRPKNELESKMIKNGMSTIKYMFRTFMCMYESTVTLWALFPLFDRTNKISLPLSGWYPYSTDGSPAFELTYLYQIGGCVYLACLNCSLDIFIAGLMVNATAQLDVLLYKLEHGLDDCRDVDNLLGDELEEVVGRSMDFVKECAVHYEKISQ